MIALATSVALATLITAEAASARPPRHQAALQAYDALANPVDGSGPRVTGEPSDVLGGSWRIAGDSDALYSRLIAPGG